MYRFYAFYLLLFLSSTLFSQDFSIDYTPIQNEGEIPKDILISSTHKYKYKKENISKKDKRSVRKAKDKFYLSSSFVIDELLRSGKVLFSDEKITSYINSVADELLKEDKKLRRKLRFYTVKSPVPNAFATDRGIIFINMGLMAKLNTEAELAFILSHEIAHYTKKDNVASAISFDKIEQESGRKVRLSHKQSNSYDPLLKKSVYSKKVELTADKLGLKRFLKTSYSTDAINTTFDILEFSHVPLNNESVEINFLDIEGLVLPDKYLFKVVEEPEPLADNDKYSTHPGVDKRRKTAKELLAKADRTGGKDFIVSEEAFNLAKTTAQFELCNLLVQNTNYSTAIYHSKVLQKKYPENAYLKRIVVYSLYGMAQYVNAEREDEVINDYKDAEGNVRRVFYTMGKLARNAKNLNLVASRYCWDWYKANPDDAGMKLMVHDQVEDMVIYTLDDAKAFFSERKMKKAKPIKDFAKLAFVDIVKDKAFNKMLKDGVRFRKEYEERKKNPPKKKDKKLGLKKALFINPGYYRVNFNHSDNSELDYVFSEKKQSEFESIIKQNAGRLNFKAEILDVHRLKSRKNTKSFNEYVQFKEFGNELLHHSMYMIVSSYNRIQPLAKKYGTSGIVFTESISLKQNPSIGRMLYGALLLPLTPWTPYGVKRFLPSYYGLQFTYVFDIKKSEILMINTDFYEQKDIRPLLEMYNYNAMYKMQAK